MCLQEAKGGAPVRFGERKCALFFADLAKGVVIRAKQRCDHRAQSFYLDLFGLFSYFCSMKIACVFFLCVFMSVVSAQENSILLCGDSITQGMSSSDGLGFRNDLYGLLQELGYPFSFRGSRGVAPYRGHFLTGANIGQFYDGPGGTGTFDVESDMNTYEPNTVVIHLGTNDVWLGVPMVPYSTDGGITFAATIAGRLANLIRYLIQWQDGTYGTHLKTIFVCQIIPYPKRPAYVQSFNQEVAVLVEDANQGSIPGIPRGILRLVDQYSTFNVSTMLDTADPTHPNDKGYEHMAGVFFDAFRTLPMRMVRLSPEQIDGLQGQPVRDSLKVRVTDDYGTEVAGVEVRFTIHSGDAEFTGDSSVLTDENGMAFAQVNLGNVDSEILAYSDGLINPSVSFWLDIRNVLEIGGDVTYYSGDSPVEGVRILWKERGQNIDTTDAAGDYFFDQIPLQNNVTLKPSKTRTGTGAVLSYDASLVARNVVKQLTLTPQMRKAADINGDSVINMYDAAHIARYAVGIPSPPQVNIGSWLFEPDSIHIAGLDADRGDLDFRGIMIGDVHGGWNPESVPGKSGEISVIHAVPEPLHGDTLVLSVSFGGGQVFGADFACEYDEEVLEYRGTGITSGKDEFHLAVNTGTRGAVRIGMFGIGPFPADGSVSISFIRKKDLLRYSCTLRQIFVNDRHSGDQESVWTVTEAGLPKYGLFQNYPNPFNQETVIRYRVTGRSEIRIQIFNAGGQEVRLLEDGERDPGFYEKRWDGRDGQGMEMPSGIYLYRLKMNGRWFTGRMNKIK